MSDTVSKDKVHFTYKANPDFSTLCQGDVLSITDDLRLLLKEIHPYFNGDQYKYFIVLTQSCDLVRREGNDCKSAYITLAAIKSFDDFFKSIMKRNGLAQSVGDYMLMYTSQERKAYQLIERLYNNTESDYFFLYKDEELGFPFSMVAYLKVSIALKSKEHYDTCLNAKIIELADEFKAKLGWLVGNIYSRVGTTDWDSIMTPEEKEKMINETIQTRCFVGEKNALKKLSIEISEHRIDSENGVYDFLSSFHSESRYDKVISAIIDVLDQRGDKLDSKEKRIMINAFKSNSKLKQLLAK